MRTLATRMLWTSALALAGGSVQAEFVNVGEPVPTGRLIQNIEEYTRTHPKDAQGFYTLGRLHSLVFAQGEKEVRVHLKELGTDKPLSLPKWPPYSTPLPKPAEDLQKRRPEAVAHLNQSLRLYRKALTMDTGNSLYQLSYGWMLEQAIPFAKEVDAPWLKKPGKVSPADWREQAIPSYLKAFALSRDQDAERNSIMEGMDFVVSWEAGQYLLRLLKETPEHSLLKLRKREIETHIAAIAKKPHAVTPIVFPLGSETSLFSLLAPDKQVTFDLDGTGLRSRWPWVGAQTGILVWDPNGTGKITSGRQLFGSVTWQMVWRNGYEPLAALDDDRNGWLEKSELRGLACWQDRNGNGKSDPGEVVSLRALGVVRLAVYPAALPAGRHSGVLCHPSGIQWQNGKSAPTYDWTPMSE